MAVVAIVAAPPVVASAVVAFALAGSLCHMYDANHQFEQHSIYRQHFQTLVVAVVVAVAGVAVAFIAAAVFALSQSSPLLELLEVRQFAAIASLLPFSRTLKLHLP